MCTRWHAPSGAISTDTGTGSSATSLDLHAPQSIGIRVGTISQRISLQIIVASCRVGYHHKGYQQRVVLSKQSFAKMPPLRKFSFDCPSFRMSSITTTVIFSGRRRDFVSRLRWKLFRFLPLRGETRQSHAKKKLYCGHKQPDYRRHGSYSREGVARHGAAGKCLYGHPTGARSSMPDADVGHRHAMLREGQSLDKWPASEASP